VKRDETHMCGNTDFILAYICDKCGRKNTLDMCPWHMDLWRNKYVTIRCQDCGGTLSWEAKNMYTGETEWRINNSDL
jgi:DNA-directed RNA polymerase subunit RPC12/RpoP